MTLQVTADMIHPGDIVHLHTGRKATALRVNRMADKIIVTTTEWERLSFLDRGKVTVTKP